MSATNREELKEQLRAMVAGRGDGIDLDTPFHWVIEDLKNPVPFFITCLFSCRWIPFCTLRARASSPRWPRSTRLTGLATLWT